MSGRGRGKGGGRGQQSNRPKSGRGNSEKPYAKKKDIKDYRFYIGSAKQSSDFDTTKEFMINHIKQWDHGADVAKALNEMKDIDFTQFEPKLKYSRQTEAEKKAAENREFELKFKEDYAQHQRRYGHYENTKTKAYGLMWEMCSLALQQKLQQRKDFKEKIEDNPIELLKAIQVHAMSYQESRYPMTTIYDAFRNMIKCKQKENESLNDYMKRFKSVREVLESQIGGPIVLPKLKEQLKMKDEEVFEQFMAYMIIANSDRSKYGSILGGLNTQYSLGNDQYPKTVVQAVTVMSNHKFDKKPSEHKKNNDKKKEEKDSNEEEENPKLSFAQMEGKCYCCGKAGHKSPNCRYKDKPKSEWAINNAKANEEQSNANVAGNNAEEQKAPSSTAWSGAQIEAIQLFQSKWDTRDWILLDTGSTTTIFCNEKLVTDIREVDDQINVSTNGGMMTSNLKANLPGWGEVWFSPEGIINVFNFGEVAR